MYVTWTADLSHESMIRAAIATCQLSHEREHMRAHLVANPPTLPAWCTPGGNVYSSFHGANVPLLSAVFHVDTHTWEVSTPGYHTTHWNLGPVRPEAPTKVYQETAPGSRSWRLTSTIPAIV